MDYAFNPNIYTFTLKFCVKLRTNVGIFINIYDVLNDYKSGLLPYFTIQDSIIGNTCFTVAVSLDRL